jgi:hypothetical protein
MTKVATIFDHLSGITDKKIPWHDLSEADQKSFNVYLVNRWLSQNPEYIELVDVLQQYTIGVLDKQHVYQLYYELLPRQKTFSKYIKGKSEDKYNEELVMFIAERFSVNTRTAAEYLDMIPEEDVKAELRKYGHNDSSIKQLLKKK